MKVIGLFSGIGGFELGFQREGFEVVSVCENDPYKQKVLKARFPKAGVHPDIRSFSVVDFLAKTYPSRGNEWGSVDYAAAFGPNSSESLRKSDLTSLLSKTRDTLGERGCPSCGKAYESSVMPACRYECEPVTWERPTCARVSGLLPTPTKSSSGSSRGGGAGRVGKWRPSLESLGYTNPQYREWMMGFPIDWSDVPPLETPAPQSLPSSSRGGLKK